MTSLRPPGSIRALRPKPAYSTSASRSLQPGNSSSNSSPRRQPMPSSAARLLEVAAEMRADLDSHLLIEIAHQGLDHVVPDLLAVVGGDAFQHGLRARRL